MTVKELKEYLQQFPDEMEVIETRHSDYGDMKLEDWSKVKVIDVMHKRGYLMRYPEGDWRLNEPTYKALIESVGEVKECVHYHGN